MVFESVVTTALNTVLGNYVENLDSSQLKLGIWGGDVVLQNLDLKQSALDDLDLPFRLKFGYLGKLTLQIPWKRIYTDPVIATVEGLHVVLVPNQGVKYDAAKEKKNADEAKSKELKSLEEARAARRKKAQGKKDEEKEDGFVEKLVAQIIKNLQVTVKEIHIRYEDQFTNRIRPFSAGVTLHGLYFQTTDENYKVGLADTGKFIYKLVQLECLSVYWNSDTKLISDLKKQDIGNVMKAGIATKGNTPDFNYVLKPISVSSTLKLNPKPESDGSNFSIPKILLNVVVDQLALNLGKFQYQDILEFAEAQERFTIGARYRKHRPDLKIYKGHSKEWWKFAMNCILEEVKRKGRNWSWTHIKATRQLCKAYKGAWIEKLTKKSPSKEVLATIERAEKELEVFNLNIARQEADLEVERNGLKRVEDQGGWMSWASSWWGGGGEGGKKPKEGDIASQFAKEMNDAEKAKLYEAIDYHENQVPGDYPKTFVDNKVSFKLHTLAIQVQDDLPQKKKQNVMLMKLDNIGTEIETRGAAKAVKLGANIGSIGVDGMLGSKGTAPCMVQMATAPKSGVPVPLLALKFETNPLDGSCDQSVDLRTQPLNVIYHAPTINRAIEIFRPPESVRLKQLSAAAMAKYETVKANTTTGLAHALEKRTVMRLNIFVQPTLLMIPETGVFTKNSSVLLVDLGTLSITTVDDKTSGGSASLSSITTSSTLREDEKMKQLLAKAYDRFSIEVNSVQILFSRPNEKWQEARKQESTPFHLLQRTGLKLLIEKASIDDLRVPKMRLFGTLPDIVVNVSDERLLDILKLALSIPTPPPAPEPQGGVFPEEVVEEPDLKKRAKMKAIMENEVELEAAETAKKEESDVQQISMELALILNQIEVNISRVKDGSECPYVSARISRMGAEMKMRTFDMAANAYIGNIEVEHKGFEGMDGSEGSLRLIDYPLRHSKDRKILELKFVQADKKSPFFATEYKMIEQLLAVEFEALNINLHQEALMDLQKFGNELSSRLADVQKRATSSTESENTQKLRRWSSQVSVAPSVKSHISAHIKQAQKKPEVVDERIVKTKVEACLGSVNVVLGNSVAVASVIGLQNLKAEVSIKANSLTVAAKLESIGIRDPAPLLKHSQILSVERGKDMMMLEFTQFNRTEEEKLKMTADDVDMAVHFRMATIRFVFLNAWLNRLLCWVHPFQEAAEAAAGQAGTAMQESAAEAAKNVQQTMPKIRLNIDLKAPLIIVPQNSASVEALLLDMGKLTIINSFAMVKTDGGKHAVTEDLQVALTDIKLARAIFTEDGQSVVAECQLLDPLTFQMTVKRNHDYDWWRQKPELTVSGRLPWIKLSLTKEDYGMMMLILEENLQEGEAPRKKQRPPAAVEESETAVSFTAQESPVTSKVVVPVETCQVEDPTPKKIGRDAAPRILLDVKIEGLKAYLYFGSSYLTDAHGVIPRDKKMALAGLEVQSLVLGGNIKEDGTTDINLCLVGFIMDDCRAGDVRITKLMDKKIESGNLIDVSYVKDGLTEDQTIDINLRPFFLCFCPEFIGAVSQFFVIDKHTDEDEDEDSLAIKKAIVESKRETVPTQEAVAAKRGTTRITAVVDSPEIIIVEDSTRPEDTPAIFLKLRADASVVSGPSGDSIQAGITQLEIFSTYYNENRRDQSRIPVLKPCDVTLMSRTTKENGQKVDVRISDVVLKVSPVIIRLLSAVGTNMSASQEPEGVNAKSKKKKLKERQGMFDEKPLNREDFWFFRQVLPAEEADETLEPEIEAPKEAKKPEQLILTLESLQIRLESGFEEKTVPLILVESKLNAEVLNWSGQMMATASMTVQVAYFNEIFSAWEPVIEPSEVKGLHRTWELTVIMKKNSDLDATDGESQLPPKMTILVEAQDSLELTITKSCLDALAKLGDAFQKAANQCEPSKGRSLPGKSPYVVVNETGMPLDVLNSDSLLIAGGGKEQVTLEHGDLVELDSAKDTREVLSIPRTILRPEAENAVMLNVRFNNLQDTVPTIRELKVSRAEKRVVMLPCHSHVGDQWEMLGDVTSEYGRHLITLRSLIQVTNYMAIPIEVYFLQDTNLEFCGRATKDGGTLSLPFAAVYSPSGEFFFKPVGETDEYDTSSEALAWSSFKHSVSHKQILRCTNVADSTKAFHIQTCGEMHQALFGNTNRKTLMSQCYEISLRAPVECHSALPCPMEVTPPSGYSYKLSGGDSKELYSVCPGADKITLKVMDNIEWTASVKIEETPEDLAVCTFKGVVDGKPKEMHLGLRCSTDEGRLDFTVYAPYWMVNRTGLQLQYRDPALAPKSGVSSCCMGTPDTDSDDEVAPDYVVTHPADLDEPLMFRFNKDDFFKSNKASLRVGDAEWSDPFPVDTVGNSGRITSKNKDGQSFDVAVSIQLSYSGLTKICTFTPFYLICSQSLAPIQVREASESLSGEWLTVESGKSVGFWPKQKDNKKLMCVRYSGTEEESQKFYFTEDYETFIRIPNSLVGVYITCSVTEGAVILSLEDYYKGSIPALFINSTPYTVEYWQNDPKERQQLKPNTTRFYAWDRITERREILWSCGKTEKIKDGLFKDDLKNFYKDDDTQLYWVSFLDGRQRILFFTDDLAIATTAHEAFELEQLDQQITLALNGVGLSLVNNILGVELAYMAITSSGIIWEEQKKKRFKAMNLKDCAAIEYAFQQYNLKKDAGKTPNPVVVLDQKMEVDFANMKLLKPSQKAIKRVFQTGLWMQYMTGAHQTRLHVKLNHLQLDNQLQACVFRTVLAPVPPPKSVAAESIPKPFTEISFVMRTAEHSNVPQIKYFRVLVQEMALKVDQGFINAVIELFSGGGKQQYSPELFKKDMDLTAVQLSDLASTTVSSGQKAFYDDLQLTPLKVHLSFSQGGSTGDTAHKPQQIQSEFLNLLLKSVGVTLTEIQDVVFKLAYFERTYVFLNRGQLQAAAIDHYAKQAIKQIYVLVLGLDIIGNPFGLIRDLSSGVEDLFYEPIQGAIQGPGEFAEGLALGVRSLFGHAVGGAAGAVSRITGTLGKGIAALTMDDDYQRKRQEMINRRPASAREGFAQGGKGLVTGVMDGVTGVFTKPWEGAKEEGAVGFAKGLGKGLIGVVARPASGVVDFASSSFVAVKKVTEVSQEVKRIRPARYIHSDKIIRPYCLSDAEGNQLLQEAEKGKYAKTDSFVAHTELTKEKNFFFVTDKRAMVIGKNDVFGHWDVEWQYTWEELKNEPHMTDKGLRFDLKEGRKKFFGLGGTSKGKVVQFPDHQIADWILGKVQDTYRREMSTEG